MQLSAFWNSEVQIMAAFTSLNSNFYILSLGRTLGFLWVPWHPCYFYAVNLGNHMVYRICFPLLSVSHCLRSMASCILSSVWVVKGGKVNPLSFTSSWPVVGVRIHFYPPMRQFYYVCNLEWQLFSFSPLQIPFQCFTTTAEIPTVSL